MPRKKSTYAPRTNSPGDPDYIVDAESGCWNWQGATLDGYGLATRAYGSRRAHRVAYENTIGPIPPEHDVHHRCGNTLCVNPDHLELAHERAHDIEHFLMNKGRDFDLVNAVLEDRRDGMTLRAICAKRDLAYSTVQDWTSGKRWTEFVDNADVRPMTQAICLLPECDNEVGDSFGSGTRRKFCCVPHRAKYNARKTRARAKAAQTNENEAQS